MEYTDSSAVVGSWRPGFATKAVRARGLRRKTERATPERSEPVEIQIVGNGFIEILQARDISLGGVGIWVKHRFYGYDIERPVEFVVKLPGRRPFVCTGSIRHRSREDAAEHFGIEFISISERSRTEIQAYIESVKTRTSLPSRVSALS